MALAVLALALMGDGIAESLDVIRSQAGLPGMALAQVGLEGEPKVWVCGVRRLDGQDKVQPGDLWHLGSDTKAMTAAMLASLAAEGKVSLDETLPHRFPKVKFAEAMQKVTLRDLLSMQGGLPHDPPKTWWHYSVGKPISEEALAALRDAASLERFTVGRYEYSNWSYVTAGEYGAAAAGKDIQTLLRERVFGPVGMKSAGFGPCGPNQPWPHDESGPLDPKASADDNPPVMTAAGRAHMNMRDWALFCQQVLRGVSGKTSRLPLLLFKEMARPGPETYAMGWLRLKNGDDDQYWYAHSGSNTLNYCTVWVLPKEGKALLVATNSGRKSAEKACTDALLKLLRG